MSDLVIAGGRLLDPGSGRDGLFDISISSGRIEAITPPGVTPSPPKRTIEASGCLLVPGLVDLHTHLYSGVSHYGIDPDLNCLARGVTTAVDAGSAGAQTFPGFRRYVIEPARTRVYAFVNIAVEGMISRRVGELEDIRWASPDETVARAKENRDVVVGVKVRLGYQMVGADPEPALLLAREAADALDLPLMCHIIDMRRPISWLLGHLGAGDVVTHCFHANEGGIFDEDGRLFDEVVKARTRGVLFDVGHGQGSFSYGVARAAFRADFPPDTISSDLHAHNVASPVFDEVTTLAKLLHCGMSLTEVVRAATTTPAAAIDRAGEIGAVAPGRVADLTALDLRDGECLLPDGAETEEVVSRLLATRFVVREGRHESLEPFAREVGERARFLPESEQRAGTD